MGHILGLRRQSAMRKLKSLGKDLFNDKGLPCNFDSNISSYIAMLENTDTGYKFVGKNQMFLYGF